MRNTIKREQGTNKVGTLPGVSILRGANKNIYYLFLMIFTASCWVSCNNEWEDEQYEQYVSFKAEADASRVTFVNIRYQPEGKVTYQLPLLISGSTPNTKSRTVHIGLDPDTLLLLNQERYGHRGEIYFRQLEERFYDMPTTIEVPAGESKVTIPIEFSLADLDQSYKWVLPLQILDDPSYDYKSNPHKHYNRAMLRINPFNDYSGTYDGTQYRIELEGDTQNPLTLSSHRAFVVDDKTIFIYAGSRTIDSPDQRTYKIFMEFTDERVELLTRKLRIYTDNPEINLNVIGQPFYSIQEAMNVTRPYLKHIYITLNLAYEFTDYTTIPGRTLRYKCHGTLTMQRDLNTLIPDEDQQIQW